MADTKAAILAVNSAQGEVPRRHLPYISPMSPLCLRYVSPISPLHLPYICPISPYISPVSRLGARHGARRGPAPLPLHARPRRRATPG